MESIFADSLGSLVANHSIVALLESSAQGTRRQKAIYLAADIPAICAEALVGPNFSTMQSGDLLCCTSQLDSDVEWH